MPYIQIPSGFPGRVRGDGLLPILTLYEYDPILAQRSLTFVVISLWNLKLSSILCSSDMFNTKEVVMATICSMDTASLRGLGTSFAPRA